MFSSTFRGGIHPPQNKLTAGVPFENLPVPHICRIPLQQHTGKPAIPVVKKDDLVSEGQLIAKADGFVSSDVHATVPGRVIDIGFYPTPYSPKGLCIVIEAEGSFTAAVNREPADTASLAPAEIISLIGNAGIVGLGGAAFPTQVKLQPPKEKTIDTLIINAAECEPYLTVDDMLMRTYATEILAGVRLLMRAINVTRCFIGMEDNKKDAYRALVKALGKNGTDGITIRRLPTKYPQGAEKQLIAVLTGREVPSGGLPMDAHVVVQNVGTAYAVHQAAAYGRPLIEKHLTVTGSIVKRPGNYKARIGMLISEILEECGGLTEEPGAILLGGPMCGVAISTAEMPIVKGSNGILVLSKKELGKRDYTACIRCGACVRACPAGLLPLELGNAAEIGRTEYYEKFHPLDCILCGSCTYVCPAKRPLTHFIRLAQQYLRSRK